MERGSKGKAGSGVRSSLSFSWPSHVHLNQKLFVDVVLGGFN